MSQGLGVAVGRYDEESCREWIERSAVSYFCFFWHETFNFFADVMACAAGRLIDYQKHRLGTNSMNKRSEHLVEEELS